MRIRLNSVVLTLVTAAIAVGVTGCKSASQSSQQSSTPSNTPAASAAGVFDLDDRVFDLSTNKAAATVVVFTRTDCPISNRFAPEIRGLYQKYEPKGAVFYLVYIDPDEKPEAIRQHLKEYAYPCQGLRDPGHVLVARCGATITPEAVVLDASQHMTYRGRINDLYADLGQARSRATTHDLGSAIEATLAGRPVAMPRTTAVGCTIADLKH